MSAFSELDIIRQAPECEDCELTLTEDNTSVDPQEAFWMSVNWRDEVRCTACKERRAADGPSDRDLPSYDSGSFEPINYREHMIDAGRGHLLR